MSDMMLLVELAGRRAAFPADTVDCVIEIGQLVPIPLSPAHVAGLAMLRSRPVTVIDCTTALGLSRGLSDHAAPRSVVVEHEGHFYGLLVDHADDIVRAAGEAQSFGADAGPGWRDVASGMVETEVGPLPVLAPAAIISGNCSAILG